MDRQQLAEWLVQSLDDGRLDDSERRTLSDVLGGNAFSDEDRAFFRNHSFKLAQQHISDGAEPAAMIRWLERTIKVLDNTRVNEIMPNAECWFSPGRSCFEGIARNIRQSRKTIDVCVFTIADDDLTDVLLKAHQRGVKVRVLTDAEKVYDRGSDINYLARKGVPVKVDDTTYHMHHKFAIFDSARLINGSFNWTRSASKYNQEDLTLSDNPQFVDTFQKRFETLWARFPDYNTRG